MAIEQVPLLCQIYLTTNSWSIAHKLPFLTFSPGEVHVAICIPNWYIVVAWMTHAREKHFSCHNANSHQPWPQTYSWVSIALFQILLTFFRQNNTHINPKSPTLWSICLKQCEPRAHHNTVPADTRGYVHDMCRILNKDNVVTAAPKFQSLGGPHFWSQESRVPTMNAHKI